MVKVQTNSLVVQEMILILSMDQKISQLIKSLILQVRMMRSYTLAMVIYALMDSLAIMESMQLMPTEDQFTVMTQIIA